MNNTLTALPGFKVGHWTNLDATTGCTVVLCPPGTVGGVDVRGGSPGTRETDLLAPTCTVDVVHAVMLAGGSAYGLAAADGAMRWLEERGVGVDVGIARVPIVPSAILFDLLIGDARVRPDAAAGYAACEAASSAPVPQGSVGAGAGATVGKALGPARAMKGGIGSASRAFGDGLVVGAVVALNAFGNVHDLGGNVIAGARDSRAGGFADAVELLREARWQNVSRSVESTTLGVIATNAKLSKVEANKVAQMAHDGLARVIRPLHTPLDGDTVFALAAGDIAAGAGVVGAVAADVLAEAVVNAIAHATSSHGVPAAREWRAAI